MSWLIGLSTSADNNNLRKEIEQIKLIAGSSAAEEARAKKQ